MADSELPGWLIAARLKWRYRGTERPTFATSPKPGQHSVWDYPRPPAVEIDRRDVVVHAFGIELARSERALKVMETASPPTFYVPLADVNRSMLASRQGSSFCEWKGAAKYYAVIGPEQSIENAVWEYTEPLPGFEAIKGHVAFYPGQLHCTLDGETVMPQPGGLYGGWVTSDLAGPFKGEPGTGGW